jgi:hypothetical protein
MTIAPPIRPLLLLDVDGVLLAVRDPVDDRLADPEPSLHPDALDWMVELAGSFDLVWATTWHDLANRLLAERLGLRPLPFIEFTMDHRAPTPKLPSVIEFVGDRPCAWIDDDLHEDADTWAAGRPVPTLLVHVASDEGMARRHVDQLLGWAAGFEEG